MKYLNKKEGSALLVAIMLMTVFITVSLLLSSILLRELDILRLRLDSGKAYYAAESGVEEALYYLNNELEGWFTDGESVDLMDSNFNYVVKNTCNSYPCLDEDDYELDNLPLENFYDVLELNETITLALFTVEDGEIKPVEDFTVEFFPAFDPATDLKIKSLSGWDVLRWKLYGMREQDSKYITEQIGDLTAFAAGSAPKGGDVFANVDKPSWFGTVDCDQMAERGNNVDDIVCVDYEAAFEENLCSNTEARDYYAYENGEISAIYDCYGISEFLKRHQVGVDGATGLNFLTLTNMMNPSVFDEEKYPSKRERQAASRIYFRVETFDDDTVREYAEILVDGYSGDSKQSLRVLKKRDSYMPVLNFSIYSTYESE